MLFDLGWRLDDVVDLIRGPKGSTVRLQVLPKGATLDAHAREIQLVRNTIQLDEQAAKKKIIEVPHGDTKIKIG